MSEPLVFELTKAILVKVTDEDGNSATLDAALVDWTLQESNALLPKDPTDPTVPLVGCIEDWLIPFTELLNAKYNLNLHPSQAAALLTFCQRQLTEQKKSSGHTSTPPTDSASESSAPDPSPNPLSNCSTTNSPDSEPKTNCINEESLPNSLAIESTP